LRTFVSFSADTLSSPTPGALLILKLAQYLPDSIVMYLFRRFKGFDTRLERLTSVYELSKELAKELVKRKRWEIENAIEKTDLMTRIG
jgi:hypothetical protein